LDLGLSYRDDSRDYKVEKITFDVYKKVCQAIRFEAVYYREFDIWCRRRPGAVEICKLRAWLYMIVDEDDTDKIEPLPNLDYKIVHGDALLSVEKNLFNMGLFKELEELKYLYFNEIDLSKKQEYRTEIERLIYEITNGRREFDFEVYFSEVFHQKGGFDICDWQSTLHPVAKAN